ncbi:MAG: phage portal protein, partial [Nitrospiria bacterium]
MNLLNALKGLIWPSDKLSEEQNKLSEEQRQVFLSSSKDPALVALFGGQEVAAGVRVNPDTAMNLAAVYACVKVISEDLASLPLKVYRRVGEGKELAVDHPLFRLLHDAPNREMTSLEFREALQGHLLLWGNAYAEIEQDRLGRPIALWPIRPDIVTIERLESGMLAYFIEGNDKIGGTFLRPDQIMHLRGLGSNGIMGFSPITMARQALGLALAEEEYRARFFRNDTTPSGLLEHPGILKPEAQAHL